MATKQRNTTTDYLFRKVIPQDGRVHYEKTRTPDVELLATEHRVTIMTGRHKFRSEKIVFIFSISWSYLITFGSNLSIKNKNY